MGQAAAVFLPDLGDNGPDSRIEKVALVGSRRMEITGVQVLDRAAVSTFPVGDRAYDGKLIGDLGMPREQLTQVEARNPCPNRLERTTILGWRRRLGIVGLELRWPAIEPKQDHGGVGDFPARSSRRRAQAQQVRQCQPAQSQGADLQEGAAGNALTSARGTTENLQHGQAPYD